MKTTGIVRKLDELGRVVIPKEVRTNLKGCVGTGGRPF
jgi:bifunctional DNA-binding transcriptional regulator/antitoxin component of YhaV-PrlF toxin-antitoxin module